MYTLSIFFMTSILGCGDPNTETTQNTTEATSKDSENSTENVSEKKDMKPKKETLGDIWPKGEWSFNGRVRNVKQKSPEKSEAQCGYEINAGHLNAFSERSLQKAGLDIVSPVILLEKEKPLQMATKDTKWDTCTGSFNFFNKRLYFSPTTNENFNPDDYKIVLTNVFPVTDSNQKKSWWLYRDYTMKMKIASNSKIVGKEVSIQVEMTSIGKNLHIAPVLHVGEQDVTLTEDGDKYTGMINFTIPKGKWLLSLELDKASSFFVVNKFDVVENGDVVSLLQ